MSQPSRHDDGGCQPSRAAGTFLPKRMELLLWHGVISVLAITLVFGPIVARAADAPTSPLVRQTFDEQIPGDVPDGWRKLWGEQGDDQLIVSNFYAVSGKKSLLLDRQSSTNTAQWGFGKPFPDIKDGWCVVSFDFLIEGAGNDTAIGVELRPAGGPTARSLAVGIGGLKVNVAGPTFNNSTTVGAYEPGKWHRLTLWAPTREGKQTTGYATLEARDATGGWKAVGPTVSVPSTFEKEYGFLQMNVAPNKRGFKLYVDDVTVEQRTGEHP